MIVVRDVFWSAMRSAFANDVHMRGLDPSDLDDLCDHFYVEARERGAALRAERERVPVFTEEQARSLQRLSTVPTFQPDVRNRSNIRRMGH